MAVKEIVIYPEGKEILRGKCDPAMGIRPRSVKWTLMGLAAPLLTASVITLIVYHGGRLLGFS